MKKFINGVLKSILIFMLVIIIAACGVCGYIVWDNSRIVNTQYTFSSDKVGEAFDGYRICVVADFHNSPNFDKVIKAVEKAQPDIICICGDLVNMEDTDYSNAKALLDGLCEITDVVYCFGNHEKNSEKEDAIEEMVKSTQADLLNDKIKVVEKNGEKFYIVGYGDDIYSDFTEHFAQKVEKRLGKLSKKLDKDSPSILIMHRPQYLDTVSQFPIDLVLAGHLHGGLINIEKIRNYILEEHFATTEYCKGEYFKNDTELIISAGIAKEDKIYRVFNSPEIVTVEVKGIENTDS